MYAIYLSTRYATLKGVIKAQVMAVGTTDTWSVESYCIAPFVLVIFSNSEVKDNDHLVVTASPEIACVLSAEGEGDRPQYEAR